jgi:outer membrane protein assembly factor BamD (BamD/ComL family)
LIDRAPRAALWLALAAGLLVAGAAAPAEEERPLDARTFLQGLDAIRQGKREDGVRLLRKVFGDFPDSPYAPQAMLKIAEMIYPVSSLDQVGSASPAAAKEAGELLQTLAAKYRSSREAPRALVKLGYLALEPSSLKGDLEEACQRFATAAQVYPDSDAADDAYFGSGVCEALRAHPTRAADYFSRLLDEHPGSPLAAEATYRYGLALSHLADPAEAMLALEEVRQKFPDSRFAARALERITLLHRMRLLPSLRPPGARPGPADEADLYRLDAEFGTGALAKPDPALQVRGASDLAIDPQGLVVLASPRSPGVFRLDAKGRAQERIAHPGPDFVAVGDGLAVFISGKDQIAVNQKNWSGPDFAGADGRPPRDFGPIAVDPLGRVYLLDRSDDVLLIYDRGRRLVGKISPPSAKEGRFIDVATGEDGAVYALDARAKLVVELHQGRETTRTSLANLGAGDPAALAVDALGDLYVLEGKTGWVYVADPAGKRLTILRPPKEAQQRLGDPSAIAVDALGRIYLAGRKSAAVVRFR